MSTDAKIRAAIESRLSTWAASQAIPVAWENVSTPTASRYLRAYMLPAESAATYFEGGDTLRIGVYQIDVCVPLGQGPGPASAIVEALESLFPAWLRLAAGACQLIVTRPPSAKPGSTESAHYVVPCQFRYRLHATA